MAKLYVGVCINQKVNEPDFKITLPDEELKSIKYLYKRALDESGKDEDTFGPKYYGQLKKDDSELAGMLESAVYQRLYSLLRTDSTNDCVQAMNQVSRKDHEGNYFQDFTLGNQIDIDLTDFPRILD